MQDYFLVKVQSEEYQGETKRRMTAVKCVPVDYAAVEETPRQNRRRLRRRLGPISHNS